MTLMGHSQELVFLLKKETEFEDTLDYFHNPTTLAPDSGSRLNLKFNPNAFVPVVSLSLPVTEHISLKNSK